MVLNFSLLQGRLVDLDFLIKQVSFGASSDQLSTQDVSLADH
jgi:hypothetical protein